MRGLLASQDGPGRDRLDGAPPGRRGQYRIPLEDYRVIGEGALLVAASSPDMDRQLRQTAR